MDCYFYRYSVKFCGTAKLSRSSSPTTTRCLQPCAVSRNSLPWRQDSPQLHLRPLISSLHLGLSATRPLALRLSHPTGSPLVSRHYTSTTDLRAVHCAASLHLMAEMCSSSSSASPLPSVTPALPHPSGTLASWDAHRRGLQCKRCRSIVSFLPRLCWYWWDLGVCHRAVPIICQRIIIILTSLLCYHLQKSSIHHFIVHPSSSLHQLLIHLLNPSIHVGGDESGSSYCDWRWRHPYLGLML